MNTHNIVEKALADGDHEILEIWNRYRRDELHLKEQFDQDMRNLHMAFEFDLRATLLDRVLDAAQRTGDATP